MDQFLIKSAHGEAELLFYDRSPRDPERPLDSFWVQFADHNLSGSLLIHSDEVWSHPSPFFAKMADQWSGWSGELSWRSILGGMRLQSRHDRRGHITIEVVLDSDLTTQWKVQGIIIVEAGQLDNLALRARAFFGLDG
jgi:hypothetical protein